MSTFPSPSTTDRDRNRNKFKTTVLSSLAVLVVLGFVGWRRYGSWTAALDSLSGVSLLIDSDGGDLGKVPLDDRRTVRFQFLNRSARTLSIVGGRVTCSCLQPDPIPFGLEPGESRPFEIRFHPKPKEGRVSETLTLYTDDPRRPVVRLNVRADVVAKAER